ncbi:MAG: beta-ketoacyl-[acyl-carrier-protein] synthase family protein, partial [Bacteroidota bacterium]|nr:beta-ketoacyl-[acyl-carrier-protein] synthase family protein [Bacteroidota bacterium]
AAYNAASIGTCLQSAYGIKGIVNTINTACSSSANAILYGAKLIRHGLARRAIVGGVDSLSKFTINGFNSLHILSPETCRPFDAGRKGLNLGEGAAFLVLEKEEDAEGKKIYAELAGYGNANDAYHPSSLSGEGDGPYLAMKEALSNAELRIDQIDFINAHGTGTENNDEVESRAMLRLFGSPPLFASTKSNIGHTLGASGAIEAAYSVLNLTHQEVYAGLHFTRPIPQTMLRPVTEHKKIPLRHVMSNSFGFGGNCTSLIFSKA